jgi:hypothetical protein
MKNIILITLAGLAAGVVIWSAATFDFNWIPAGLTASAVCYLALFGYANLRERRWLD